MVGGLTLSFVLALILGVSGVIAPRGGIAVGASTVLTIISGEVQVSRDGGAFEPATDGAVLAAGHTLRTGPDGRAILTYFEGSTVSVEPSTELSIDEASAHPDGSTVVTMTQNLGRTWHVVTRLITGDSRYEVRTPAATASVRGTGFEVGVVREASGEIRTDIVTTEGIVAASAPATAAEPRPEPVVVAGGFQSSAKASERRMEQPRLSPEAERRVTVSVGSGNSIVVDPLGRANGMRDGRLVLQTPGAQLTRVDGKLVITLPNLPDGKISTVVKRAAGEGDVPVTTTVHERGRPSASVDDTVRRGQTSAGVDLRRSAPSDDAPPALRRLDESEKQEIKPPKVGSAPAPTAVPRARLGLDATRRPATAEQVSRAADEAKDKADRAREEQPRTTERSLAPEARTGGDAEREQPARSPGFVRPLPFQGAPVTESRPPTRRSASPGDYEAARQLERAAEQARRAAEAERERLKERQAKAEQEATEAAEKATQAEQQSKDAQERAAKARQEQDQADEEARDAKSKADQKALEEIARQRAKDAQDAAAKVREAEELQRKLEQERLKAAREAEQNAEQQRRLHRAAQDAQKVRDSVKPPAGP